MFAWGFRRHFPFRRGISPLRRRVSFPAMGKKPKDRWGTAQDGHFVSIFAFPPDPHLREPPMRRAAYWRKGAGGLADRFSLVFRCRLLGSHRNPGTPLFDSTFVAVGLNFGSEIRRALERPPIFVGAGSKPARLASPGGPLPLSRGRFPLSGGNGNQREPKGVGMMAEGQTDEGEFLNRNLYLGGRPKGLPYPIPEKFLENRRGGADSPYQGEMSSVARQRGSGIAPPARAPLVKGGCRQAAGDSLSRGYSVICTRHALCRGAQCAPAGRRGRRPLRQNRKIPAFRRGGTPGPPNSIL